MFPRSCRLRLWRKDQRWPEDKSTAGAQARVARTRGSTTAAEQKQQVQLPLNGNSTRYGS